MHGPDAGLHATRLGTARKTNTRPRTYTISDQASPWRTTPEVRPWRAASAETHALHGLTHAYGTCGSSWGYPGNHRLFGLPRPDTTAPGAFRLAEVVADARHCPCGLIAVDAAWRQRTLRRSMLQALGHSRATSRISVG
jgi:hypothetical protein